MKTIIVAISICFFIVLQASFLASWPILSSSFLPIIAAILISLFERRESYNGLALSFFIGLTIDFFSSSFLGFYAILLISASLVIKFLIKPIIRIQN